MGHCSVTSGGRAVDKWTVSKSFELLALLALSPYAKLTRDNIVRMLWLGDDRCARNRLSVATYLLKQDFEKHEWCLQDLLASERNEMSLITSNFTTDASPLLNLDLSGKVTNDLDTLREAISCYNPPVLPGCQSSWARQMRRHLWSKVQIATRLASLHAQDSLEATGLFPDPWTHRAAHMPTTLPIGYCVVDPMSARQLSFDGYGDAKEAVCIESDDFITLYRDAVKLSQNPAARILVHITVQERAAIQDCLLSAHRGLSTGLFVTNAVVQILKSIRSAGQLQITKSSQDTSLY